MLRFNPGFRLTAEDCLQHSVFDAIRDACAEPLRQKLWQACGQPDPEATRTHTLHTPDGPLMLITETWRRGMLFARP